MRVARWRGALVAATLAVTLGLYAGRPGVVLLGVVPLTFVAYGQLSTLGDPTLAVEREIAESDPVPGDEVAVRLRIENAGDRTLPDVRVVDGVPDDVPVVAGSARLCTSLAPGDAVTLEYAVKPPRGDHAFDPPTVRARNLAGTVVDTLAVEPDGDPRLTCETLLDSFPVHRRTIRYVGGTPTDVGGGGVEFHATREYRRGDPLNRIDWNRLARTGELTTVEFRTERSVVVVFVIDDRPAARIAPPDGGPDAVDLGVYAASRGLAALLDRGHRVGVASLRAVAAGLGPGEWVDPGGGATTRTAAAEQFAAIRDGQRPPEPRLDGGSGEENAGEAPGVEPEGPAQDEAPDGEPSDDGSTPGEGASSGRKSLFDAPGDPFAAPDDEAPAGPPDDEPGAGARDDRRGSGQSGGHRGTGPAGGSGGTGPSDGSGGTGPAGGWHGAVDGEALGLTLAERLPSRAQVVVCTPLVDEVPGELVTHLAATGHPASVLSPDVLGASGGSPGRAVAALDRSNRVFEMQAAGVPTVDWSLETPLAVALSGMFARTAGGDPP